MKQQIVRNFLALTSGLLLSTILLAQPASTVAGNMGDPSVLATDQGVFLTGSNDGSVGTGPDWGLYITIPILQSSDGIHFRKLYEYVPSTFMPNGTRLCWVGAPSLAQFNSRYLLFFQGAPVAAGQGCRPVRDPGTHFEIYVVSWDNILSPPAAAPLLVRNWLGQPAWAGKIDPALYCDAASGCWLFYVQFNSGNEIWRVPVDSSTGRATGQPVCIVKAGVIVGPDEEGITEAPAPFFYQGWYYLFYSAGDVIKHYRIRYLRAKRIEDLRLEAAPSMQISEPIVAEDGSILGNQGSVDVKLIRGQPMIYYHVGRPATGNPRYVEVKPLIADANGFFSSLTNVTVQWRPGTLPYVYSLDVKLNDQWYGPCIGANKLGSATKVTFTGNCPSLPGFAKRPIDKSMIQGFRVYGVPAGSTDWSHGLLATYEPYNGSDDVVDLSGLPIFWNQLPGYTYSLDAVTSSGTFAPCIASNILPQTGSYWFDGNCYSTGASFNFLPWMSTQLKMLRLFWLAPGQTSWSLAGNQFLQIPYGGAGPADLSRVRLTWTDDSLLQRSIDAVVSDPVTGSPVVIGPCISAGRLVFAHGNYTFDGECPDAQARWRGVPINLSSISEFRLVSLPIGRSDWQNSTTRFISYSAGKATLDMDALQIQWATDPGFDYSLDVADSQGWVAPCLNEASPAESGTVYYQGHCPDMPAGMRSTSLIPKETIQNLRLCWKPKSASWSNATCSVQQYDGRSDSATFNQVKLFWTYQPGLQYSLDVIGPGGAIRPCLNSDMLMSQRGFDTTSLVFGGGCPSSPTGPAYINTQDAVQYQLFCLPEGQADWRKASTVNVTAVR